MGFETSWPAQYQNIRSAALAAQAGQNQPQTSGEAVFAYNPELSANDNALEYYKTTGDSSALGFLLANKYNEEMSNTAIQRAVADAEKAGISKYQLFQSGNAAASSPSSAGGFATSSENEKTRENNLSIAKIKAIAGAISSVVSSALRLIK